MAASFGHRISTWWAVVPAALLLLGAAHQADAAAPSFDLRYGVLAGLTGNSAVSGQGWNAAVQLGVAQVQASLKRLNLPGLTVALADSQDSQGSPQAGVEAAQKLVTIDRVSVIIGDFYSSVTSAAAAAVAIPNKVVMFTGGTSPALSKLNTTTPSLIWQPVAADDMQGRILAQIVAGQLGKTARINVAARNDAYGANLSAVFKQAWLAGGGTIPALVIYNQTQPTLDTEAQQVVAGDPQGWLFVDFCETFAKLAQPMLRTGKWDPSKSFGSDTLNDCQSRGSVNYPGMHAVQANASSGAAFPAYKALFAHDAPQGVTFQSFTAEAFDSVFVSFLAAVAGGSADPVAIAAHVPEVTNDPGKPFTFEQLDDAVKALLAGEKIHFMGATGPLNFAADGRVGALAYDVWEHQPDGHAKVIATVTLQP